MDQSIIRKPGVKPFVRDDRDLRIDTAPIQKRVGASPSNIVVDMREWCPPVHDQLDLGSCTAFACCAMREFLMRKYPFNENHLYGTDPKDVELSRMYLYYRERERDAKLENTDLYRALNSDEGAQLRTAVWAMNHYGACYERDYKYNPRRFAEHPESVDTAYAYNLRGGAYHQLLDLEDMINCIESGYGFIIALNLYSSFMDVGPDGRVPVPNRDRERYEGGHAMFICGKDDKRRVFIDQNSWGRSWGDEGYCYIPYDYITDRMMLIDSWMMHQGSPWIAK